MMASAGSVPKTDYTIASVTNALDVLSAFQQPPHEFGVTELGRRLELTTNQMFRLLKTLESSGFVLRSGSKYTIGYRVFEIGQTAGLQHEVIRAAAHEELEALTSLTGETSYLMVERDIRHAVCIDVAMSRHVVRGVVSIGTVAPLYVAAAGKVILSFIDEERREACLSSGIESFTEHTLTVQELRRQMEEIRRCGYAAVEEEYQEGADAIGAPVRNASGKVVAGLALVGATSRMRTKLHTELPPMVRGAAARISGRLSGTFPDSEGRLADLTPGQDR